MKDFDPPRILEDAAAAIRERAASRDLPGGERSMKRAVDMFNALRGGDRRLSETEGWLFMCCLKMARATAGAFNPDDYVDLVGYGGLAGESAANDWNRGVEVFGDVDEALPEAVPAEGGFTSCCGGGHK